MRTICPTRYVAPLREGGSLPGLVEADDDGLYVLKFRGAGQGAKALVAELIAGEIARALDLPMPEVVFAQLDPVLGRSEPDSEIRNLILASGGLNLALDFLPGSLAFDAVDAANVDADLASRIVWFDAFVTNIDRSARNTNLLVWHRKLYLIDNGAALYFQHSWNTAQDPARNPFAGIQDHVLLGSASRLEEADAHGKERLTPEILDRILSLVPDEWLGLDGFFAGPAECRAAYRGILSRRLAESEIFVTEARNARARLV